MSGLGRILSQKTNTRADGRTVVYLIAKIPGQGYGVTHRVETAPGSGSFTTTEQFGLTQKGALARVLDLKRQDGV